MCALAQDASEKCAQQESSSRQTGQFCNSYPTFFNVFHIFFEKIIILFNGGPKVGATQGGGQKPRKMGTEGWWDGISRLSFPLPPQFSFFLYFIGGLLVEFCGVWRAGALKCARLEFSGCRVKPLPPCAAVVPHPSLPLPRAAGSRPPLTRGGGVPFRGPSQGSEVPQGWSLKGWGP